MKTQSLLRIFYGLVVLKTKVFEKDRIATLQQACVAKEFLWTLRKNNVEFDASLIGTIALILELPEQTARALSRLAKDVTHLMRGPQKTGFVTNDTLSQIDNDLKKEDLVLAIKRVLQSNGLLPPDKPPASPKEPTPSPTLVPAENPTHDTTQPHAPPDDATPPPTTMPRVSAVERPVPVITMPGLDELPPETRVLYEKKLQQMAAEFANPSKYDQGAENFNEERARLADFEEPWWFSIPLPVPEKVMYLPSLDEIPDLPVAHNSEPPELKTFIAGIMEERLKHL